MRLPYLFYQVHANSIFNVWMRAHQPPVVSITPQEPLGRVCACKPISAETSVTIVRVRCWNDRGVMKCEAATPADLKIAQEWAAKHANTPPEDFKWFPTFGGGRAKLSDAEAVD